MELCPEEQDSWVDFRKRMYKIYNEIDNGDFAREWQSPFARLKFKVIKYFAMRQSSNKIEAQVRKSVQLNEFDENLQ